MMLYKKLAAPGSSGSNAQDAIDMLDDFRISNDMFKEHLLDLSMNKDINIKF